MLICVECGAVFDQAKIVFERHGLDTPPYEKMYVCPRCESTDIHEAVQCEICGEWITGDHYKLSDGGRVCEDCCVYCAIDEL